MEPPASGGERSGAPRSPRSSLLLDDEEDEGDVWSPKAFLLVAKRTGEVVCRDDGSDEFADMSWSSRGVDGLDGDCIVSVDYVEGVFEMYRGKNWRCHSVEAGRSDYSAFDRL